MSTRSTARRGLCADRGTTPRTSFRTRWSTCSSARACCASDNELGYLLRALRNTYNSRYRVIAQRPVQQQLSEEDGLSSDDAEVSAREMMEAIASAPDHLQRRGDRDRPGGPVLPRGRALAGHPRSDDHDPPAPRTPTRRARAGASHMTAARSVGRNSRGDPVFPVDERIWSADRSRGAAIVAACRGARDELLLERRHSASACGR